MGKLVIQQKDLISNTESKIGPLENSVTTIDNTVMTFRKQLKMVENRVEQLVMTQGELQTQVQFLSRGKVNQKMHHYHAIEVQNEIITLTKL